MTRTQTRTRDAGFAERELQAIAEAFARRSTRSRWTGFGVVRRDGAPPAAVMLFLSEGCGRPVALARARTGTLRLSPPDGPGMALAALADLDRALARISPPA